MQSIVLTTEQIFLHYYYVLYKLFELLDQKDYIKHIPMLKDREKLIEQDTIWKKNM